MPTADFKQPPCCDKPSVTVMDTAWPMIPRPKVKDTVMVNRMCLRCGTHWCGKVGRVKQYTREQWERYVNNMK